MKTLIKVFSLLIIVAACNPVANSDVSELEAKRDSLRANYYKTQKELIHVEKQIALLDTSASKDDLKLIKKITMQKNRIAKTELKIRKLEDQMTAEQNENLTPVAVKVISPEVFNHYIKVYGKVEADNFAQISPEIGGKVEKIHVGEGQNVSKGTLLVSLNTSAIDKQIEGIKGTLELTTSTFEKQETLWEQGIGSEIQYLSIKNNKESLESQLEALEAQKRMSQIRAPFDGIVDKIFPKKGELAAPGFPVVVFVNLKEITVKADLPEHYIGDVKVGQNVDLSFASLEGHTISTPVRRVSEVIDPISRTFEIELNIHNPGGKIKPNMVSTIRINDYSNKEAFVIPSLVIRKDITGDYLYVIKEEEDKNIVRKQYVKSGLSYEDESLIEEGLALGDRVVIKGYHLVSSGVPVKVVE